MPAKHYARNPLIYPRSLYRFLYARSEPFAKLPEQQRHYFAGILYASHFRPQRHTDESSLQCHHWHARWLACQGTHQHAYKNLGWWTLERHHNYMERRAAGYALTPEGQAMIDLWLGALDDYPADGLLNAQGIEVRRPRSAVNPRTGSGANAKPSPALRVPVEIDGHSLHQLSEAADAWLYASACPAGFEWAWHAWDEIKASTGPNGGEDKADSRVLLVRRLADLMAAAGRSTRAPGFVIPQTYIEAPSGRLYSETNISLQNCPREVKRAALVGQWEYDFENCHWSLLYRYAQGLGIDLPAVRDYLQNKKATREKIAEEAGISEPDAKACIIALVYGAGLRADPRNRIPELIGIDATKRLGRSETMINLNADVKRARPEIIKAHRKPGGVINAASKKYTSKMKSVRQSLEASQLAHILQGAESEALRACMDVAGPSLTLLQHDGFTSLERLDRNALQDAIKDRLGFALDLSEEQL